jgi:hypothetical protein
MTVDRKQRYVVIAKRDGAVVESAAAHGDHLLPTVLAHLTFKHLGAEVVFRKVTTKARGPKKVRHLRLVTALEPDAEETIAEIVNRVLGGDA